MSLERLRSVSVFDSAVGECGAASASRLGVGELLAQSQCSAVLWSAAFFSLSRRPAPASKGLAVHFGHENWNTVINIMVGIRLAAGRASSEPQRAVGRYDFVMKEKFSILPNTGMVDRARGGRRSLVSQGGGQYTCFRLVNSRVCLQAGSSRYIRNLSVCPARNLSRSRSLFLSTRTFVSADARLVSRFAEQSLDGR